jgi:hypothetical protein
MAGSYPPQGEMASVPISTRNSLDTIALHVR